MRTWKRRIDESTIAQRTVEEKYYNIRLMRKGVYGLISYLADKREVRAKQKRDQLRDLTSQRKLKAAELIHDLNVSNNHSATTCAVRERGNDKNGIRGADCHARIEKSTKIPTSLTGTMQGTNGPNIFVVQKNEELDYGVDSSEHGKENQINDSTCRNSSQRIRQKCSTRVNAQRNHRHGTNNRDFKRQGNILRARQTQSVTKIDRQSEKDEQERKRYLKQKRDEKLRKVAKENDMIRLKEAWKLAKIHRTLSLMRRCFSVGWGHAVQERRLKVIKAENVWKDWILATGLLAFGKNVELKKLKKLEKERQIFSQAGMLID